MATTSLICGLILMQLMPPTALTMAGCTSEVLKTPAVYLVHIGNSDKPIFPIVIATGRPNEQELRCAALSLWRSPEVFLVSDEELAQGTKLLKGNKNDGEGTAHSGEFRYVLVSKLGTVESGILDRTQSHEIFASLATYFDGGQPELHEHLTVTNRRF
jgi:hypothetical protein